MQPAIFNELTNNNKQEQKAMINPANFLSSPRLWGLLCGLTLAVALLFTPAGAGTAQAATTTCDYTTSPPTCTTTFTYTGAAQSWTAPSGVTQATFVVDGAQGGTGQLAGGTQGTGGLGARAQARLTVSPGQIYQLMVGGTGSVTAGGFNGGAGGTSSRNFNGGGGGGASDVRNGACAATLSCTLTDRRIIAGGAGFEGGGGGGSSFGPTGATFQSGVRAGDGQIAVIYTPPDDTGPVAHPTLSPAANAAGWNNTNVTVNWNWTDDLSGIVNGPCEPSSTSNLGTGTQQRSRRSARTKQAT